MENSASKLSQVLNFYIATMVQEILSNGGDVIKYSGITIINSLKISLQCFPKTIKGDAFLSVFKTGIDRSYQDTLHKAIDTALVIQKNCKNFLTDIGVVLNGLLFNILAYENIWINH